MGQHNKLAALPSLLSSKESELLTQDSKNRLDFEFFFNFSSEHTRRAYRNDLIAFFDFLHNFAPDINTANQIERFHVVAYRQMMEQQQLAPKSINRRLSALASYCDFLLGKNLMEKNPCHAVKRPRQEVKRPTRDLSDDQVMALMQSLEQETPSAPLHRAVIYLLFSTGIRVSELIYLRWSDLEKQGQHWTIQVRAKGGKELSKVVHPRCIEQIELYRDWLKSKGSECAPEDWMLIPTRNPDDQNNLNKPLNPKSVQYIIKTWCQRAGIVERISPHSARATYIGSALEAGEDIYRVSRDVGHANVQTTQLYDKRRRQHDESPSYSLGYLKKSS